MPNGGVIGPENVPTVGSASGVWSLSELYDARLDNVWPFAAPDVVLNASVWLDAADTSTITESGGAVSQWNNKGSLGNFTQATGAVQPTTGASTLNGLNVIDFAADYFVSVDSAATYKFMHDGTKYFIAAVAKMGVTADPDTFMILCGSAGVASATVGTSFVFDDRSSQSRNNGFIALSLRGVSAELPISAYTGNDTFVANTATIYTALMDPDNATAADRAEQFINNGSAIKTNTQTFSPSTSNPVATLQIGAGNATLIMSGYIAELVIVSGADATETNRVIVRDYLNLKWGVY
jgi:hypothetical protein